MSLSLTGVFLNAEVTAWILINMGFLINELYLQKSIFLRTVQELSFSNDIYAAE